MKHLEYLRIANFVFAGITSISAISALLGALGVISVGAALGEWVIGGASGGVLIFVALFEATEATTLVITAQRIRHGRWRLVQSSLSIICFTNVPVGMLFGLYSIWVCWVNPETRARFER